MYVLPHMSILSQYAYGTSHMRILIWDVHTRMGRPIVPYKYIFMDFNAMIFTGLCAFLQLRIVVYSMHALMHAPVMQ